MDTTNATWNADPLFWGTGPTIFEMFLEPTCPFSVRAFRKIDPLLDRVGRDRVTVKIRLQSQPWHMFSGVIVRCIVAASTLPTGREAARTVLQTVADHREGFEFDHHCRGPNMDATPNDIIARLEDYTGLHLKAAFDRPELERVIKWHCKYSRQNGIHVSPTFMINGLIHPEIGSGDDVQSWAERLLSAPAY